MSPHLSIFKLEDALLAALHRGWSWGANGWEQESIFFEEMSPEHVARVVIDELTSLAKNDLATVAGAIGLVRVHSKGCLAVTDKSPCSCGWFPPS